jgi:hypothetical protein
MLRRVAIPLLPASCIAPAPPCRIHPASKGYTLLAELLVAAVSQGVEDAAFGRQLAPRDDARLAAPLPPMIPSSADERTTFCAMQASHAYRA